MKKFSLLLATIALTACATGSTPEAKKTNARKETASALAEIYADHPSARSAVAKSKGYLVCTGNDNYLFAAASGGGICTFHKGGKVDYYRFASLGAGVGIGFKKVALLYVFQSNAALKRFVDEGWDAGARAEASARHQDEGGQMAANTSVDVDGVRIYQSAIWGAAAQATVQGYKFWRTDFTRDVIANKA